MDVMLGNIAADMHAVFELQKNGKDVVDSFASLKACFLPSCSVYSDWRLMYPTYLKQMLSVNVSILDSIALRISNFFTSFSKRFFFTLTVPGSLSFLFLGG